MNAVTETRRGRLRIECLFRSAVFSMLGFFALSAAWAQGAPYNPQYPQYPGNSGDGRYTGGSGPSGGFTGYQGQPRVYGYGGQAQGEPYPAPIDGYQGQQQPARGYDRGVGGPGQEHPVSRFQGYTGQQPAYGYGSPVPSTGHVPTPGFRFRETDKRPEPEIELPQFRPDSMMGNPPYGWGGSNYQWSPGAAAPAPVFRPLDDAERERAKRSAEGGGKRYQGGYVSPPYGYPVQTR